MRVALKLAALDGTLIARLADAEEPFWKGTGDAVAAVADEMLATP